MADMSDNSFDSIFVECDGEHHVFGNLVVDQNRLVFERNSNFTITKPISHTISKSCKLSDKIKFDLPVIVHGYIELHDSTIFQSCPKLTVHGSCQVYSSPHKCMPNNIVVFGELRICCQEEVELPAKLYANKLIVWGCAATVFPTTWNVVTSLQLDESSKLTNLNLDLSKISNLIIPGSQITNIENLSHLLELDVSHSKLACLPKSLRSVITLDISNTEISSIPDQAQIGTLYASNSKISHLPKPLNNVFGFIDVGNCPITELPEGLLIKGGLDISGTLLNRLPNRLSIDGILNISRTGITYIDDSISGNISEVIAEETPLDLSDVPERLKSKLKHLPPTASKTLEMAKKGILGTR